MQTTIALNRALRAAFARRRDAEAARMTPVAPVAADSGAKPAAPLSAALDARLNTGYRNAR